MYFLIYSSQESYEVGAVLSLFYRQNWGTEKLSKLPKAMQLISPGWCSRLRAQVYLSSELQLLTTIPYAHGLLVLLTGSDPTCGLTPGQVLVLFWFMCSGKCFAHSPVCSGGTSRDSACVTSLVEPTFWASSLDATFFTKSSFFSPGPLPPV